MTRAIAKGQTTDDKQGISFIVKCRNEEAHLRESLLSLSDLEIPYEINLILHLCDDGSKGIAEELKSELNLNIFEYDLEVSRAGYETFVTPEGHPNSLVTYHRFCNDTAKYRWTFKWDADFLSTEGLILFLNGLDLQNPKSMAYRIPCKLGGQGGHSHKEIYLSNCVVNIAKYTFWEVFMFSDDFEEVRLGDEQAILSVPVGTIKGYWNDRTPWFIKQGDEILGGVYRALVDSWGPEPVGMARASSPDIDHYMRLAGMLP